MRKLLPCLAVLVLVCIVAASVDAQTRPNFVTKVSSNVIKPGQTVAISAIFLDASKVPALASRDAIFLVGLSYSARRFPFVMPIIPIGKATFKRVVQRNTTMLQATIRFQFPKIRLPARFRLPLFFQGVALAKSRTSRANPVPATPAAVVLTGR